MVRDSGHLLKHVCPHGPGYLTAHLTKVSSDQEYGFRLQGSGLEFGIWDLGFGIWGLGFVIRGVGFMV